MVRCIACLEPIEPRSELTERKLVTGYGECTVPTHPDCDEFKEEA